MTGGEGAGTPADNGRASGRRSIPAPERLKLWVRAGGRCEICNRYMLEGQMAMRELTFGQLAHIVGQQDSAKSPRGQNSGLGPDERDNADNLMLVCDDEHDELDKTGSSDAFDVDLLRALKKQHEDRVRYATSLSEKNRTTPIRMLGWLRGNAVELGVDTVATTVMAQARRFPRFDLSLRNEIEIDLRGLPGEADGTAEYYATAGAVIDRIFDHKVSEGVATDAISHLSIFAFARLPLIVYLGRKLDDNVPTDVYQRSRAQEDWKWLEPDGDAVFEVVTPPGQNVAAEGVLLLNISGTIQRTELPGHVNDLPIFEMAAEGDRHPDVIASADDLAAFTSSFRGLLSRIEKHHKDVRLLHVFAAMPISSAVVVGRVMDPDVHPATLIYDRTRDGYVPALQIGTP